MRHIATSSRVSLKAKPLNYWRTRSKSARQGADYRDAPNVTQSPLTGLFGLRRRVNEIYMPVERNFHRKCPFLVRGLSRGTPDFLSQVSRPLFICSFWTRSVEWCQKFVFSDEPFDAPEASHEDLGHRRLTPAAVPRGGKSPSQIL